MPTGIYKRTNYHIERIKEGWKSIRPWNWKGGKDRFPNCEICGNKLSSMKYKKCMKCYSKEDKRGINNINWKGGKPTCIKCGKTVSRRDAKICFTCRNKSKVAWNKGKICPQMQGERQHLWKGGISKIYKTGYQSPQYRQWRRDVFIRDEFTCQECGVKHIYLTAHHIKSFAKIIKENSIKSLQEALKCKELWDINNGKTVCEKCHSKIDKYRARFKIGVNNGK